MSQTHLYWYSSILRQCINNIDSNFYANTSVVFTWKFFFIFLKKKRKEFFSSSSTIDRLEYLMYQTDDAYIFLELLNNRTVYVNIWNQFDEMIFKTNTEVIYHIDIDILIRSYKVPVYVNNNDIFVYVYGSLNNINHYVFFLGCTHICYCIFWSIRAKIHETKI